MVSPVVGVTPYNTIVFSSTETIKILLSQHEKTRDFSSRKKAFIAGSLSGGMALFIYNPVELLKVRAQVNRQQFVRYSEAIPEIVSKEGYKGLYKGFMPLLWRDVPGWGAYFCSYEFLKNCFGVSEETPHSYHVVAIKMWSGGVAGQISWLVSYPWDIIKTKIQCNEQRVVSTKEVIRQIYT